MNVGLATCVCGVLAAAPVKGESIWVEGENPVNSSVQRNGWYDSVKKDALSGGGALKHWGSRPGEASYFIEVPKPGRYALWLRANPVQSAMSIRFDDGAEFSPDLKKESHEQVNVASDNKPDLRFVSWVRGGQVDLDAGRTKVSVRFLSRNHHHGMLDCFCLTTDTSWRPSKTLKPGEDAPYWAAPEITASNLDQWMGFIRPSREELGWRAVRWHRSLSEAAEEAERLERPILLWAMNGHPCGET
jgi:hypothetical protein